MYEKIADETRNKVRLEKKLEMEKKKKQQKEEKARKSSKSALQKEQEAEANRRLQTEMLHQTQEAKSRALGKTMMSDAVNNKPSLNISCLKVLNNFQGRLFFMLNIFSVIIAGIDKYHILFILGSFKSLKRNNVKLHDNMLRIIQEREQEKKDRQKEMAIIKDLQEEVRLLVIFSEIKLNINNFFFPEE